MIGFMITAQPRVRTQAEGEPGVSAGSSATVQRAQELLARVSRLEEENAALQNRVRDANQQIREYEMTMYDSGEMAEQLKKTLENARMEAGLVALSGEGLTITIDNLVLPATGQVVKYVQDEDLLSIINELNAAGAEAIAINGERVIATTEVRMAGNFININTRAHAAPFTISAIGNPKTLGAAMHLYGGVVDTLSQITRIEVDAAELVEIPAYEGVISYQYAQVAA